MADFYDLVDGIGPWPDEVYNKAVPTGAVAAALTAAMTLDISGSSLDGLWASYIASKNSFNLFPQNWGEFITDFRSYVVAHDGVPLSGESDLDPGRKETTRVATTDGSALDQKYIILQDEAGAVGVWFTTTGSVTPPPLLSSLVGRTIRVSISASNTDVQVATALKAAIHADASFSATSVDNIVEIEQSLVGVRHPPSTGTTVFSINTPVPGLNPEIRDPTIYEGPFIEWRNRFRSVILGSDPDSKEWDFITNGMTGSEKESFFDQLFLRSFQTFLNTYPYPAGGAAITASDFLASWTKWMTQIIVITENTVANPGSVTSSDTSPVGRANFPSYEVVFNVVYKDMYPDSAALKVAFNAYMANFMRQMISINGFFIPSHHLTEFGKQLQTDSAMLKIISLTDDERTRRSLIWVIYDLLIRVMQRLQKTVEVQGQHIIFLTDWQKQYGDLMSRVPLYQSNPPKLVGPSQYFTREFWKMLDGTALRDSYSSDILGGDEGWLAAFKNLVTGQGGGLGASSGVGILAGEGVNLSLQGTYAATTYPDSPSWEAWLDTPGFAGITLREINEHFAISGPPNFLTLFADIEGADKDPPLYDMFKSQGIPGVYWLIEQPWGTEVESEWDSTSEGKDATERQTARSDINDLHNSWIEKLRSTRNILRDDAKQAQSNLGQTKEAINQQAQMLTAIITLLSGITQSIYR